MGFSTFGASTVHVSKTGADTGTVAIEDGHPCDLGRPGSQGLGF